MILRFCSGSVTPASRVEKQIGRIDEVERQLQLLAEPLLNLVRFVVTQQPVVDEDARQPIADRAMNQHRRDGRIHAARQARTPPCPARPAAECARSTSSMNERSSSRRCSRRRRRRSSAGSRRRDRCARLPGGTAARTAAARALPSPRSAPSRWSRPRQTPAARPPHRRRGSPTPAIRSGPDERAAARDAIQSRRYGQRAHAHARTHDGPSGALRRRACASSAACRSRCRAPECRGRRAPASHFGAPSSDTLLGPPERMSPTGFFVPQLRRAAY